MNLSELTSRLRVAVGNLSASQVPDASLWNAINEAYQHLLDRYIHSHNRAWFKFSTTVGQGVYTIPGHIGEIRYVWDVAIRKPLRQLVDTDLQSLDGLPNARPTSWIRAGQQIVLYPAPSGAWEIGVQGKIVSAPLTSDDDEPILDQTWHDGIVRRATYEWYDHYAPDQTKAAKALVSWNEWITTKPSIALDELRPHKVEVPELAHRTTSWLPLRGFDSNVWGLYP